MSITVPVNSRGPILDLTLPACVEAIDLTLRNKTTGKQLSLVLPAGWDGTDLSLDFRQRTIRDASGSDRSALLDPEDNDLWSVDAFSGAVDVEIEATIPTILSSTKSPGTVASDASFGNTAWSNPGNASASDNSRATVALETPFFSRYLKATNYGFAIPAGATVLGVSPAPEISAIGKIEDAKVRLVNAGVVEGEDKSNVTKFWPEVDTVREYGGPVDLWGLALTPSKVNASTFGVVLAVIVAVGATATAQVDYLPMTVYYKPAPVAYAATAKLRWEKGYY